MFDAHCHMIIDDSIYCTAEFLPQNYDGRDLSLFEDSTSEIGLDRRFEDRIPMADQEALFEKLLDIKLNKNNIVTIHCVRATERIIKILRRKNFERGQVIWHSFTGSAETSEVLNKLGVIISISPKFKGNFKEITDSNPMFLLETDYEGNSPDEHKKIIQENYRKRSEELGTDIKTLEEICRINSASVVKYLFCP